MAAMTFFAHACTDDKQAKRSPNKELKKLRTTANQNSPMSRRKRRQKEISIALLGQTHKDTFKASKTPAYDENFNPLSLLHADRMEVLRGNTIEARDVSLELYDKDGASRRHQGQTSHLPRKDAILRAEEAIYISGKDFQSIGNRHGL